MALLELNFGGQGYIGSLSLVYTQNSYFIKLKLGNSTHQLRLNRPRFLERRLALIKG